MASTESADKRCTANSTCGAGSVCALPSSKEKITRIVFQTPESEKGIIILWKGPREEIWEEVQVSEWIPRVSFLPLWIPQVVETFWSYLTMATVSLYFFNLLPFPHLDGQELMESALEMAFSLQSDAFLYDIEALEFGSGVQETTRQRRRMKDKIAKSISYGTFGVFLSCIPVVAVNWMGK
jgi:S2P endopeptidase